MGGGIAQLSRDMLQHGVSHRCAWEKLSAKGGHFLEIGNFPEKVSRNIGVSQQWSRNIAQFGATKLGALALWVIDTWVWRVFEILVKKLEYSREVYFNYGQGGS